MRSLLFVGLLFTATPAFAQEPAPDSGTFGVGAFFLTNSAFIDVPAFTPGISGTFWAIDRLTVNMLLGFDSVENEDTHFLVLAGVDYYLVKEPRYGAFLGGSLGVNVNPSGVDFGRDPDDRFLFRLEGGGEYFAGEHLGIFVSPGLSFSTEPTFFGLTTMAGARVYF